MWTYTRSSAYTYQLAIPYNRGLSTNIIPIGDVQPLSRSVLQADQFTLQAGGIASGGQSGVYSADGKEWLIEGPGLSADDGFEVDNLPVETYLGTDRQIGAAVVGVRYCTMSVRLF